MKTPFATTVHEMLKAWAPEAATLLVGAALLVFLLVNLNSAVSSF